MSNGATEASGTLVTFALLAFNQEHYIDAAVKSALAQDWSDLEIIVSDDCSTDSTFARIEDLYNSYRGRHSVRINRNGKTLGIAEHVNAIMKMTSGELIVIAAGDDISYPSRTSELANLWIRTGRCVGSFCSGYDDMDVGGQVRGSCIPAARAGLDTEQFLFKNAVVGAAHAWSRGVFDVFGPLQPRVTHEDRCIAVRSSLLGGVYYIPKALVAHRRGGASDRSSESRVKDRQRNAFRYICDVSQALTDFEVARLNGLIDAGRYERLVAHAGDRLLLECQLLRTDSLLRTIRGGVVDVARSFRRSAFALYKLFQMRLKR